MLSEKVGVAKEKHLSESDGGVTSLKQELEIKYPALKKVNYSMAVNKNLSEKKVKNGDEVALLPPFAGG